MYTMNELLNMGQIERQARARIRGEIASLKTRAADMQAAMGKALEAEDAEGYSKADFANKSIQAQLDKQQAELTHLEQAHSYSDDNVLMAWADFAVEYNAQFDGALAEYEAARHELAHKFHDLMAMQGKAQFVRAEMNRLLHPDDVFTFTIDNRLAPLDTIPNGQRYKAKPAGSHLHALVDAVFFCQHDDIPRRQYADMAQIAEGAPIDPTKPTMPVSPLVRAYCGYDI